MATPTLDETTRYLEQAVRELIATQRSYSWRDFWVLGPALQKRTGVPPTILAFADAVAAVPGLECYRGQYHVLDKLSLQAPTSPITATTWAFERAFDLVANGLAVDAAARQVMTELLSLPSRSYADCIAVTVLGGMKLTEAVALGRAEALQFGFKPWDNFFSDPVTRPLAEKLTLNFGQHVGLFEPTAVLLSPVRVSSVFAQQPPAETERDIKHGYDKCAKDLVLLTSLVHTSPAFPILFWLAPQKHEPLQGGAIQDLATVRGATVPWSGKDLQSLASTFKRFSELNDDVRTRVLLALSRLHPAYVRVAGKTEVADAAIDARIAYEIVFGVPQQGNTYKCALRAALFLDDAFEDRLETFNRATSAYGTCSGVVHEGEYSSSLVDAVVWLCVLTRLGLTRILDIKSLIPKRIDLGERIPPPVK